MKKTLLLSGVLLLVFQIAPTALAEPTNVGEFVFISKSATLPDYRWALRFTVMGNGHIAIHGEAWPGPVKTKLLPPEDPPVPYEKYGAEPVVGTAIFVPGLNVLRMILEKNAPIPVASTGGSVQRWEDNYAIEFPLSKDSGSFTMIRHEYSSLGGVIQHLFDSGSFSIFTGVK